MSDPAVFLRNVKAGAQTLEAKGVIRTAAQGGLEGQAVIKLAQRLKPQELLNFDQAIIELESAVGVALDVIARGERGTNLDAFISAVPGSAGEAVQWSETLLGRSGKAADHSLRAARTVAAGARAHFRCCATRVRAPPALSLNRVRVPLLSYWAQWEREISTVGGDGNVPLRSLSAALLLSVGLALAPVVARADSLALRRIVHDACEPHAEAGEGPKPCENVNLARGEADGVAILKDLHGVVQMLAIPTRRITGIEDPQMLAPDAPNVFADAWKAKALLEERLGRPLPRESVALTINSKWARSQEQLHVHVDCLAKSVAEKLDDYRSALDDRWRAMTVALNGRMYFARRLELDGSFGRRTAQTARRRHRGRQRSYGRLFAGCGWRDFRRKARVHPARRQLFAGGRWPRRGPSGPRLRDHGFWAMN